MKWEDSKVVSRVSSLAGILLSFLILLVIGTLKTQAAVLTETKPGSSVSLEIPDTSLEVSGCVAPNSLVTITKDNVISAAVSSGSNGLYNKLFSAQTPSLHTISTFYEDAAGRRSSTASRLVALPVQTVTKLIINQPPTIEHQPKNVEVGGTLTLSGYACPDSSVTVKVDNNLTLTANSDAQGNWQILLNTINFYVGTHTYTVASSGPYQSEVSRGYQFSVVGSTTQPAVSAPEARSEDALSVPVITSPTGTYLSSTREVDIRGTSSINTRIEIFVDSELRGSVFSNSLGEWIITLSLQKDSQTVEARSCNDNECSGFSNSVQINYVGDLAICELVIDLDSYSFRRRGLVRGVDLDIQVANTSDSYDLITNWGDADIDHQTTSGDDRQLLHHTYDSVGNYNGSVSAQVDSSCYETVYFTVAVEESQDARWWLPFVTLSLFGVIWGLRLIFVKRKHQL